jgi:acetoin utilization deacetylase AcuC-like enzyme
MGFCLFNNIAIAARYLQKKHGLGKLAIVDFDVHHGNGTEEWAKEHAEILFCSSHQFPFYPGTGYGADHGPFGNIVNIPLHAGTGGAGFRHAMENFAFPKIDNFKPELIMISAGFDAHRDDPLANLDLTEENFRWITSELCKLADRHCHGRMVSTLEGGYDLDALAKSAGTHVKALMQG